MGFAPPGCWKGTFVDCGQIEQCERIEMEWRFEEGLIMVISGGVDGMKMDDAMKQQTRKATKWGRNTAATDAGMDMGVVERFA